MCVKLWVSFEKQIEQNFRKIGTVTSFDLKMAIDHHVEKFSKRKRKNTF